MSRLAQRTAGLLLAVASALSLSACQSTLMSDDRMASTIAGTIGVPLGDVTLSDRRAAGPTNTFVTATTRTGKVYACTVNGGGLLAAGIINPPTCTPK